MSASSKPIHRKCFGNSQKKNPTKNSTETTNSERKKKYKTTNMKKARLNSDSQQF